MIVDFSENREDTIESECLSALQDKQPTYAIGPVFPNQPTKSIVVATNLATKFDSTEWLGCKPHGSILYISFGSIAKVAKNVIKEG